MKAYVELDMMQVLLGRLPKERRKRPIESWGGNLGGSRFGTRRGWGCRSKGWMEKINCNLQKGHVGFRGIYNWRHL